MAKISITGDLGSGKSTVCGIISADYNFQIYHTGKIQREIAEKYRMTTLELNKYSETNPEIDKEIDGALINIGKLKENIILDSRMAWHFVPDSFKVYLKVNVDVAAQRVMLNTERGNVESYKTLDESRQSISLRKKSENERYKQKYGVDCTDYKNFDLIVDTSNSNSYSVAKTIMETFKKWEDNKEFHKFWISPTSISPLKRKYGKRGDENGVKIIEENGVYYLLTGADIVSEAISSNIELIPVSLLY